MIRGFSFACLVLIHLAGGYAQETISAEAETDGMSSIFNGKDLKGWSGDSRLWSVKDGAIHGETTPQAAAVGNTFLIWQGGTTEDFELRLKFRCNATNNSGIQYRSKHITEGVRNDWVVRGYQHEIRNENELPNVSGFIYDEGGKRGRIILVGQKGTWEGSQLKLSGDSLISRDEYKQVFKLDDWNEVKIVAKGRNVKHYMNGRMVMDFTDSPERVLTTGVLALQLHAGKPMWVDFKDIQFKEL